MTECYRKERVTMQSPDDHIGAAYAPDKNRTCARGLGNRCSIH
jgi:hypothetical protein